MDEGPERISDVDEKAALRRKGRIVSLKAAVFAVVLTGLAMASAFA